MSENPCTVSTCDKPAPESVFVCPSCMSILEQALCETDWLVDELTTTIVGEKSSRTDGDGGRSSERRLPFHIKAADVLRDFHGVLGSWARMLAEERPEWTLPADDPKAIATWLLRRLPTIAGHAAGGDLVEEVSQRRAAALWVIDRPADRWYAGVCSVINGDDECDAELYATTDRGVLTCRQCGTHHDIGERRGVLLKAAEGMLVTATEAASALAAWSDEITDDAKSRERLVDRIRKWADPDRGRLLTRGHVTVHGKERATYRLGDILDLLTPKENAA